MFDINYATLISERIKKETEVDISPLDILGKSIISRESNGEKEHVIPIQVDDSTSIEVRLRFSQRSGLVIRDVKRINKLE